jgi:hypothetical protein
MAKCIFCPNQLGLKTKPEHILLAALGGRKTSRKLICSNCNSLFGATIDAELAKQFAPLRSMFGLKSGNGDMPPGVKVTDVAGRELLIRPDGALQEFGKKPFTVKNHSSGPKELSINVTSREQLEHFLPNMAAATGTTAAELRVLIQQAQGVESFERAGLVKQTLNIGGGKALRSLVKQCSMLWAAKTGNAEAHQIPYAAARSFILNDSESFRSTRVFDDTRDLPEHQALSEAYGPIYSSILVCSDFRGRVVGNFNAYTAASWSLVLAEDGGMPNKKAFLVSNSLNTASWSGNESLVPIADASWLDPANVVTDQQAAVTRFSRLMSHYAPLGGKREVDRIVKDAWDRLDLKEGDVLTKEHTDQLAAEISLRFVSYINGIPFKRPFKF